MVNESNRTWTVATNFRARIEALAARLPARRTVAGAILIGAALALAAPTGGHAARTRFFQTEGYEGFRKLELVGMELSEEGEIGPGLAAERVGDPEARTVWRLRGAGDRLVASTGDKGQVFRTTADGVELVSTLYNYELFALAVDDAGNIYAAGAPSGSVVRVGTDGKTETLFTAPEGLVFDLLLGRNGSVFAATGERGRIYQIRPDGTAEVFAETGDAHARTLAWAPDGQSIWVGTNGRGLLQRIELASGKVSIAYDAPEEEIVAIVARPDGSLLFAANPGPQRGAPPSEEHGEEPKNSGPRARLYQMDPSGSVRVLWTSRERTVHDLLPDEAGSVLVATGTAATLYRVDPEGRETVLWRAEEEQVLSLFRGRGGALYAGTGNPGRIYRLGPDRTRSAALISEVLDASDQARWGKLSWEGSGPRDGVGFESRSGYTATPDETWSDWEGTGAGQQIASPPGRYLQWRATFSAEGNGTTRLKSVRAPYLLANRAPAITKLTVSSRDAGFRSERPGGISQVLPGGVQVDYSMSNAARGSNTLPPEGVPSWIQQLRTVVWTAEDPDSDDLVYTLEIRPAGETDFRPVARDLRDPAFTLETGLLPDGSYELRVVASDAPSNAPGEERVAVRISPTFQVDNQPPTVVDLRARKEEGTLVVQGRALDTASPLRAVDVSVDGGPFQGVPPLDALLDSAEEAFEARLPLEEADAGNWIVVRARDAAGNEGTFRAWLEP